MSKTPRLAPLLSEQDPDLTLVPTERGFIGLYRRDLPVEYAQEFMDTFTKKTGANLVLIVNAQLATEELINRIRLTLREEADGS